MADMRDVARAARVSISTVSHVLNSTRFVSPELRQRVLDAAESLQYSHNAVARSLRTRRTQTIGLVIPDVTNPFYPEVARGVLDVADQAGYTAVLCNSDRDPAKEIRLLQALARRRVDGIILSPSGADPALLAALERFSTPVVLLGSRLECPECDVVRTSPRGAFEPVRHLGALGHRRIGLIGGAQPGHDHPDKFTGYAAALDALGIPLDPALVVAGDFTQESGRRCMLALLAVADPPTAVFAGNDLMAIGALLGIREAGLKAPDDVSVVGFDDIPQASITTPRLTTVAMPKYAMGRTAAELLLDRLDGRRSERASVELPHSLVIRESTGPPPARPRAVSTGQDNSDRGSGGDQAPVPTNGGEPAR